MRPYIFMSGLRCKRCCHFNCIHRGPSSICQCANECAVLEESYLQTSSVRKQLPMTCLKKWKPGKSSVQSQKYPVTQVINIYNASPRITSVLLRDGYTLKAELPPHVVIGVVGTCKPQWDSVKITVSGTAEKAGTLLKAWGPILPCITPILRWWSSSKSPTVLRQVALLGTCGEQVNNPIFLPFSDANEQKLWDYYSPSHDPICLK